MEIKYTKVGDYYIPNITNTPNDTNYTIGKYGRLREKYLRDFKPSIYNHLIMTEQLVGHLLDIDKEAKEYLDILIKQIAEKENVTEKFKETDQLKWVQEMNNIKNRAEEIVLNEIIYKLKIQKKRG